MNMWMIMAVLSVFLPVLTAILVKCGVQQTDVDIANLTRIVEILIFSWLIVYITGAVGKINGVYAVSLVFMILLGMATGLAWLCYFRALALSDVNKVVPINKTSIILSVLLAIVIFNEYAYLYWKLVVIIIIFIGTLLMVDMKKRSARLLHAVFSRLTTILAKFGIDGIDSNLAVAVCHGGVIITP